MVQSFHTVHLSQASYIAKCYDVQECADYVSPAVCNDDFDDDYYDFHYGDKDEGDVEQGYNLRETEQE
jgi:hypothetical protein